MGYSATSKVGITPSQASVRFIEVKAPTSLDGGELTYGADVPLFGVAFDVRDGAGTNSDGKFPVSLSGLFILDTQEELDHFEMPITASATSPAKGLIITITAGGILSTAPIDSTHQPFGVIIGAGIVDVTKWIIRMTDKVKFI